MYGLRAFYKKHLFSIFNYRNKCLVHMELSNTYVQRMKVDIYIIYLSITIQIRTVDLRKITWGYQVVIFDFFSYFHVMCKSSRYFNLFC